jgi:hypothetical protein
MNDNDYIRQRAKELSIVRNAMNRVKRHLAMQKERWVTTIYHNMNIGDRSDAAKAREDYEESIMRDLAYGLSQAIAESVRLRRCRALRGKLPKSFIDAMHRQYPEMSMNTKAEKSPYGDRPQFYVAPPQKFDFAIGARSEVPAYTAFIPRATIDMMRFANTDGYTIKAGYAPELDTVYYGELVRA